MNRIVPYDFITEKMEQLSVPNSQVLWEKMQKQLDKEMPVENNRRRRLLVLQLSAYMVIIGISISLILFYKADHKEVTTNINTTSNINTTFIESAPATNASSVHAKNSANNNEFLKSQGLKQSTIAYVKPKALSKKINHNSLIKSVIIKSNKTNQHFIYSSVNQQKHSNSNVLLTKKQLMQEVSSNQTYSVLPIQTESNITEKNESKVLNTSTESNELNTIVDNRTREISLINLSTFNYNGLDSVQEHNIITPTHLKPYNRSIGWVAGISVNYHHPVSNQEMSTVNINGKQNALFDYLPSVFLQYHFSGKWYAASELGWVNPQYTPNLSLYNNTKMVTMMEKNQQQISLNKLYYLNVPVTINYKIASHFYFGAGIEYSYLKRSILSSDESTWDKQGNTWVKTKETKSVISQANPHALAAKSNNSGNGNGNNGNRGSISPADSVAESFRSHDWRFVVEMNYQYHRFAFGMNFAMGITPYINIQTGNNTGNIKDRNESIQLYLHYNLFDRRR